MPEAVRLAKRVAELVPCSRSEAEQYIEGGWVRVDGQLVELPQHRVLDHKVEIDPKAKLAPAVPVTVIWHKPAGYEIPADGLMPAALFASNKRHPEDRSGIRALQRHLVKQLCVTPLEAGASGLLVASQEYGVRRKLLDSAALVESELIVDVKGSVTPEVLQRLSRAMVIDGRAMLPAKVSISNQTGDITGLRFAVKGSYQGQIAQMCEQSNLTIVGMKRNRVGRIPLAGLAPGQWRYLMPYERF